MNDISDECFQKRRSRKRMFSKQRIEIVEICIEEDSGDEYEESDIDDQPNMELDEAEIDPFIQVKVEPKINDNGTQMRSESEVNPSIGEGVPLTSSQTVSFASSMPQPPPMNNYGMQSQMNQYGRQPQFLFPQQPSQAMTYPGMFTTGFIPCMIPQIPFNFMPTAFPQQVYTPVQVEDHKGNAKMLYTAHGVHVFNLIKKTAEESMAHRTNPDFMHNRNAYNENERLRSTENRAVSPIHFNPSTDGEEEEVQSLEDAALPKLTPFEQMSPSGEKEASYVSDEIRFGGELIKLQSISDIVEKNCSSVNCIYCGAEFKRQDAALKNLRRVNHIYLTVLLAALKLECSQEFTSAILSAIRQGRAVYICAEHLVCVMLKNVFSNETTMEPRQFPDPYAPRIQRLRSNEQPSVVVKEPSTKSTCIKNHLMRTEEITGIDLNPEPIVLQVVSGIIESRLPFVMCVACDRKIYPHSDEVQEMRRVLPHFGPRIERLLERVVENKLLNRLKRLLRKNSAFYVCNSHLDEARRVACVQAPQLQCCVCEASGTEKDFRKAHTLRNSKYYDKMLSLNGHITAAFEMWHKYRNAASKMSHVLICQSHFSESAREATSCAFCYESCTQQDQIFNVFSEKMAVYLAGNFLDCATETFVNKFKELRKDSKTMFVCGQHLSAKDMQELNEVQRGITLSIVQKYIKKADDDENEAETSDPDASSNEMHDDYAESVNPLINEILSNRQDDHFEDDIDDNFLNEYDV